jgi:hypothetical protein
LPEGNQNNLQERPLDAFFFVALFFVSFVASWWGFPG